MYFIQRTEEFDDWLAKLKDLRAKAKIKDIERAKSLARKYEDILDEWS